MSRIGKKPISAAQGVKYKSKATRCWCRAEGQGGDPLPRGHQAGAARTDTSLRVRENDSQAAVHGLARALVNNAVEGVTKGWTRELEIVGIGYRAEMKGKGMVVFTLGYSHPIEYPLPTGVDVAIDPKQTQLTVTGIDRQKVGQVAAEMRSLRPPDPYKNKGVRYAGEKLEEEGRQDRSEVAS